MEQQCTLRTADRQPDRQSEEGRIRTSERETGIWKGKDRHAEENLEGEDVKEIGRSSGM